MGILDWLFKRPQPQQPFYGQTWKVGDRVLAKWLDSYFYPGRITQVMGDRCEVAYDDGDISWVHVAHIVLPDIKVGSRVFAVPDGGNAYLPGKVTKHKGDAIQVQFENGREEWTSMSRVKVKRQIVDVGDEGPPPGGPGEQRKEQLDLGDPLDLMTYRIGDRILGRWVDFFWYPGTILGMGTKGIHVLFDDGDQRIIQENQMMPLVVEEDEELYIRPKKEPQLAYPPARVIRVNNESLDVEFEDGTIETNTRVSRARFWRCPVGVSQLQFEEGDRVLAADADNCIYPAEIVSIQDEKVIVQYLDGPERMLTPELIQEFDLPEGTKVESRWKGGPHYFPGVLDKVEGERVFIKYDDGDEEWTSIRLVRIPKTNTIS